MSLGSTAVALCGRVELVKGKPRTRKLIRNLVSRGRVQRLAQLAGQDPRHVKEILHHELPPLTRTWESQEGTQRGRALAKQAW